MKKLLSLLLALAIVASFAITAFAEENVGVGSYSSDVTGNYVAGTTSNGTVFSVDIAWTSMSFTYHAEKAPVWNVDTHSYSDSEAAYWEGDGTITVTNHSNAKISAVPTYTPENGYEAASMVFSTEKLRVASAESGNAEIGTITVTPSGSLPEMNEAATIGSITVTIAQDNDISVAEAEALYAQMKELEAATEDVGDMTGLDAYSERLKTATDNFKADGSDDNQTALNNAYAVALSDYNRVLEKNNA